MNKTNVFSKIISNRERIVCFLCFFSVLCFNVLALGLSLWHMFTYDGGAADIKSYGEIKDINEANGIFSQEMVKSYLYGLIFAFPLVYAYFFTKRINLNAILIQLLPILIFAGEVLFYS